MVAGRRQGIYNLPQSTQQADQEAEGVYTQCADHETQNKQRKQTGCDKRREMSITEPCSSKVEQKSNASLTKLVEKVSSCKKSLTPPPALRNNEVV